MKGIIFTLFQDMVEETVGLDVWEQLISSTDLSNDGIYVAGLNYPDADIVVLLKELSAISNKDLPTLLEAFGSYILPHLVHSLPPTLFNYTELWSFLRDIDSVIHTEVKKLSPDALTPDIIVIAEAANMMDVAYQSPRQLCFLAIGLIKQSGEYFNMPVRVQHKQCMHDGHDRCILHVVSEG